MKRITFLITVLTTFLFTAYAQTDSLPVPGIKQKQYKVALTTSTGEMRYGWLYYIEDTTLALVNSDNKKDQSLLFRKPLTSLAS